jgi:hypothetical protein
MDLRFWIQALELSLMHREILIVEIAEVDCASAILRELVGGGAADAEGGIGSGDDGDAGLKPSGRESAGRAMGENGREER